MDRNEILSICDEENVRFLRLQFTDLLGVIKNVEVPRSQFEKALDGQIMFDGSSIQGFTRIEESDMLLKPEHSTFTINPWTNPDGSRVARMICDVYLPDESPFPGCPRLTLKRQVERSTSFNEAFLTDNQGANVAAFPATSDYWQGDEEKWTASFQNGNGVLFIGPLEQDESTQTLAVQVSAPVFDRGRTVGVLVVGITFTYLEARQQ